MNLRTVSLTVLLTGGCIFNFIESVKAIPIPDVNPWRLQKPVLFNDATASYYYKRVVLAGSTPMVQAFLDHYDLTARFNPNYTSATRTIWANCKEIVDPYASSISQTVCTATELDKFTTDERIFSDAYAEKVAQKVFAPN